MAAQMAEVKKQAEDSKRDAEQTRKQQAEELERFRKDLQNERANAERSQVERDAQSRSLTQRLEDTAKRLTPGSAAGTAPVGLPALPVLPAQDMPVGGGAGSGNGAAGAGGLRWIEPLDKRPVGTGLSAGNPSQLVAATQNASLLNTGATADLPKVKPDEPAYTVPRNATLLGSTAMTALVGRVPVSGQVQDPFPFKVLVAKENLAANGLQVPGVFGMVFSGTAFGDWTLGCVRGYVDSATFVFDDGRIRTVSSDGQAGGNAGASGGGSSSGASTTGQSGSAQGSGAASSGNATTVHKGLGWISDKRGIPCVSGVRISNATDYLAGRMLAMGIETAGKAYARAQQTITTTPLGGTTGVVNNPAQFALGETVSGSSSELAKFIAERQAQMFDVIYVDTGAEVAIHIDREIPIDYQPNGRKLDYANAIHAATGRGGLD
jgi:integrating conjugative element protein (TIGR03752 family)